MSQQKALFAVAMFVGLLALCSAQQFDLTKCSNQVRAEIDAYSQKLTQASSKFTSSLSETGGQAVNTEPFRQDIDKLVQSVNTLSNLSNGFDIGKITSVYMDNASTVASLFSKAFRLYLVSGTIESYADLANEVLSANTNFFEQVRSSCIPVRRMVRPLY